MIATYADYVWPCYIATGAMVIINIWLARHSLAKELKASRRRQQMQSESAT